MCLTNTAQYSAITHATALHDYNNTQIAITIFVLINY